MTFKRLLPLAAILLCLTPARADLIKQGATYQRTVLMTSVSDHVTGATGLTLTVTLSKAGAAYSSISPTITELGSGVYSITLATGNTSALGALDMHVTATGADPADTHDQIVAFDPTDAAALGLSSVSTAATQATAAASGTASNGTTLTALNTKLGTPAGASMSADILTANTGIATANTAIAVLPAATVVSLKADSLFAALLKRGMVRFSYNESTKTYQPEFNDGTTDGSPITLSIAPDGTVLSR